MKFQRNKTFSFTLEKLQSFFLGQNVTDTAGRERTKCTYAVPLTAGQGRDSHNDGNSVH